MIVSTKGRYALRVMIDLAQPLQKAVLHQYLEDVLQILFRDLLPGGTFR